MKYLLMLLLISNLLAEDPKPDVQMPTYDPLTEILNRHLQSNYYLKISKNLILTGNVVKDFDKSIDKRAYTDLKFEF